MLWLLFVGLIMAVVVGVVIGAVSGFALLTAILCCKRSVLYTALVAPTVKLCSKTGRQLRISLQLGYFQSPSVAEPTSVTSETYVR